LFLVALNSALVECGCQVVVDNDSLLSILSLLLSSKHLIGYLPFHIFFFDLSPFTCLVRFLFSCNKSTKSR